MFAVRPQARPPATAADLMDARRRASLDWTRTHWVEVGKVGHAQVRLGYVRGGWWVSWLHGPTGTMNSTLLGTADDAGAGMSFEMARLRAELWVTQHGGTAALETRRTRLRGNDHAD